MPDGTTPSSDLTAVLSGLRDEISALRVDLVTERHERQEAQRALDAAERNGRITRWVGWVVIVVAVAVGTGWVADRIATADRRAEQACSTRVESRDEIRTMGVALTAYVVEVAGVDPDQAAEILAGAEQVALDTLPPPDC